MQKLYFSLSFILIAIATDLCATSTKVSASRPKAKIEKVANLQEGDCTITGGACTNSNQCCQYLPFKDSCCANSIYGNVCIPHYTSGIHCID